jgi:hypothetical protein
VPLDWPLILAIATVVVSAVAAGASLDQSIKQLPARRRIGVVAYSVYSLAADTGTALRWYLPLAALWVALVFTTAIVGWSDSAAEPRALALAAMVVGVVAHILVTALYAAPTLLSQRMMAGDEAALQRVFDRFERWQAVRAAIDVGTLAISVLVLIATLAST